jgi:hypothetical protein
VGSGTVNGMIFIGGGKAYSEIGSTRSDGGLILGKNIYARYKDNYFARVGKTTTVGFSGIKLSSNGVVDFFGKNGNVEEGAIANKSENIKLRIDRFGNVGVGTTTPNHKLDVKGTIRTQELKVDMQGADFVFENNYQLRPLEEVETFIKDNKHLPEIAPAKEMQKNGVNQSEMNQKLLQKIEELTLYTIEQDKLIDKQNKKNKELTDRLEKIEKRLTKILNQ